jgi:phosphoribosylglycinamide formyltransferase 2
MPTGSARWTAPSASSAPSKSDQIFQAKGHHYSTRALVGGDAALAAQFENGHFATLYLSPKDYHRIHMPCAGQLTRMIYVPGDLFSVNPATARGVPGLFARNERVVCVFDTARGPFVLVLVGATIVGSMATTWHGVVNPPRLPDVREWRYDDARCTFEAGRRDGPLPARLHRGDAVAQGHPALQPGLGAHGPGAHGRGHGAGAGLNPNQIPVSPNLITMTTLGTPLSHSATKVMLLGSGELGKEVLIALQRLGVETIAVDRYDHAPGQQVAHHARTITMSDPTLLRALIEADKPDLVVPEIEAIATPMLEVLEATGVVRVIPTARAARLTMDREGIRRLAAETLGLPTSPYKFCDTLAELQAAIDAGIGYPCIVKPVMSSSGKGQSKIDGPADVQKAWDCAMAGGRVAHGRIIVEGFIDFDYEITLLTVRAKAADGTIETHFCEPIGHVQVSGDYVESWQPHPMHPAALEKARQIAKAVTDDLGIGLDGQSTGLGLFGVELFVKGDQVWFSEVSPRPHDTGMVTMTTQWQNEFELHARAILGLPVNTALRSPGASAVIYGGVDAAGIVFDGVDEALRVPNTDIRLFGKPESFVKRRMGVALAFDADVEVARTHAKLAASKVRPRAA